MSFPAAVCLAMFAVTFMLIAIAWRTPGPYDYFALFFAISSMLVCIWMLAGAPA